MTGQWLRIFFSNPSAVIGLALLVLIGAMSILAPILAPVDPWDMVGRPFLPPFGEQFSLGTDTLGRDVFAGIVHGSRVSLIVGLVATIISILMGLIIGGLAGYFSGKVDLILMRFTEVFQTIPSFVLAILLVAIFQPSIASTIFAIALVSWPPIARLTRAEFLTLRNQEYVAAAIAAGRGPWDIATREILPNAIPPIVVMGSLGVATAILLETAISFLGLGDPNVTSWGYMIGVGRTVLRQAWWMSVFPGLAIIATVLAVNLVGEGLNDAFNPRLREGGRAT